MPIPPGDQPETYLTTTGRGRRTGTGCFAAEHPAAFPCGAWHAVPGNSPLPATAAAKPPAALPSSTPAR